MSDVTNETTKENLTLISRLKSVFEALVAYFHNCPKRQCVLFAVFAFVALFLIPLWFYFLRAVPIENSNHSAIVQVTSGDTARSLITKSEQAGMRINSTFFLLGMRLEGNASGIHTGRYSFNEGDTLSTVVRRFSSGLVDQTVIRISDGINFRELRLLIADNPDIEPKTAGLSESEFLQAIGITEKHPEGLFAPETFHFNTGTTDIAVYRLAYLKQKEILEKEWASRAPKLKLKNPYQALILASLIEKETGVHTDRYLVSSVFHNRLKIWMPLQTDPTVIYALGENYRGKIRKRDLQIDSPYNTYINYGLPPTPIAMPSAASIRAALHPAKTNYLYFVARGDGTTKFSNRLIEHNEAVTHYQKKKKKGANQ